MSLEILISNRIQDFFEEMSAAFEMESHSYKRVFCQVNYPAFSIITKPEACFISKSLSPALSRLHLKGSMSYSQLTVPGDPDTYTQYLQSGTKKVVGSLH